MRDKFSAAKRRDSEAALKQAHAQESDEGEPPWATLAARALSGPSQRRLTVDRTQQSCRTCIIDGAACSDACGVRCTACVRCGAERWPLVDSPACGSRQLSHGNETRTESLTQQHALLQQPTSGKLLLLALKSVSRRAALDVLVPADNHQVRDCLLRSFNHVAAAPPLGESKLSLVLSSCQAPSSPWQSPDARSACRSKSCASCRCSC